MKLIVETLLITVLLFHLGLAGCNNPFVSSSVLLSSPTTVTAAICTNITSRSCCTEAYYTKIAAEYEGLKTDLKALFTNLYQKFQNITTNLTLTATPTQISSYLVNAYSFSKLTSNGEVFNNDYILATSDFVSDIKISLANWKASYDTCIKDVMQHQAGLACAMCDSDFITNYMNGNSAKLRWSVCNKLVHSCYQYLYDRVYITNLANIALTLTTLINNKVMFDQYIADTNITAKYEIAKTFKAISYDTYKFPDECVDNLDCKFICKSMVSITGPVLKTMTHPTDLSNYNTNFRRMLDEYAEMLIKREEPAESVESYQERKNRRMLQSSLDAGNGFILDVNGYDTYKQGNKSITVLDYNVGISSVSARYLSASILFSVIIFIANVV